MKSISWKVVNLLENNWMLLFIEDVEIFNWWISVPSKPLNIPYLSLIKNNLKRSIKLARGVFKIIKFQRFWPKSAKRF